MLIFLTKYIRPQDWQGMATGAHKEKSTNFMEVFITILSYSTSVKRRRTTKIFNLNRFPVNVAKGRFPCINWQLFRRFRGQGFSFVVFLNVRADTFCWQFQKLKLLLEINYYAANYYIIFDLEFLSVIESAVWHQIDRHTLN